jgi:hypothetical protein
MPSTGRTRIIQSTLAVSSPSPILDHYRADGLIKRKAQIGIHALPRLVEVIGSVKLPRFRPRSGCPRRIKVVGMDPWIAAKQLPEPPAHPLIFGGSPMERKTNLIISRDTLILRQRSPDLPGISTTMRIWRGFHVTRRAVASAPRAESDSKPPWRDRAAEKGRFRYSIFGTWGKEEGK